MQSPPEASVRRATTADADAIRAIYEPIVRDTVISFETEVPDRREFEDRIRGSFPRFPWLVIEDVDGVRGYAYAGEHRKRHAYQWSVEVSVYIAESSRGRGVGRRLYRALFDILVRQGFRNAYAGITLPSGASRRLHEGMGFESVGVYRNVGYKFGAWHDVGWWHLVLSDPALDPEPPRTFEDVADALSWDRY